MCNADAASNVLHNICNFNMSFVNSLFLLKLLRSVTNKS